MISYDQLKHKMEQSPGLMGAEGPAHVLSELAVPPEPRQAGKAIS